MVSLFTCKWGEVTDVEYKVIQASGKKSRCVLMMVYHTMNVRRSNFKNAVAVCGHVRHAPGQTIITVELNRGDSADVVHAETMELFERVIRQRIQKTRARRARRHKRRGTTHSPLVSYSLNSVA